MDTKKQGKGAKAHHAEQLIVGTSKHLAGATQFMIAGDTLTQAEVTARLQALVGLRRDVEAAKAALKAALAAEDAGAPGLRAFAGALSAFVRAGFGNAPEVLADFGLRTRATTPLTVEAKTAAVAKRKATRAARHTMGAVQKRKVKGVVMGVHITPVTATDPTPSKSTA